MAGLPQQNIPIPFAQGVSTKLDPKQVPLGKLLTLENGVFQTPMELRKRYGYTALSQSILGGGTLDNSGGLFTFNDEILQFSPSNATPAKGGYLYGYDSGNSAWSSVGPFYNGKITTEAVSTSAATEAAIGQIYPDGTYDSVSGLSCYAWSDASNGDIYASINDETTGKLLYSARIVTTPTQTSQAGIRVLIFNSNFFIIYTDGGSIKYVRFATSAPTAIAGTGTIVSSDYFDALVVGSRLYVVYGTATISMVYLNTSYAVSSPTSNGALATIQTFALCSDGGTNIGIAVGTDLTAYGAVFDTNLSVVLGATNLTNGGATAFEAIGVCFTNSKYHIYGSSTGTVTRYARFTTAGASKTIANFMTRVGVISRPFVYNGQIFVFVGARVALQDTVLLLMHYADCDDSYPACVVGKAAYAAYGPTNHNCANPAQTVAMSSGIYRIAYMQQNGVKRTHITDSAFQAATATWALTTDFTVPQNAAQIANGTHISGGQLWLYDGRNITEHGFHFYPSMTLAQSNAAGTIANGTYQYVTVYEWTDGQGQVHRSAPSLPVSITVTGANDTVVATAATLSQTNKRGIATTGTVAATNPVKVCLYRTTNLGTIFYFTASSDNDITAATVTVTDLSPDATIINNIQLYTTGGVVDNSGAPACSAVTTYKSRLVLIPSENPYSWWFSQEVIPDSEATQSTPVEMSDIFIQNIDQKGGALTGCLSMDDKLILMKRNLPYYVVGNGPGTNGANNDYSPPQEITSPVGTALANSLVLTPMGIMFEAADSAGIWLLDRGLNTSYIGSEVEAYNSQSVTSAVAYPKYNQIRFSMSGGVALVFDYFVNQWTVFTNIAAVQAVNWRGSYTYMRSTALALQESTSTFTDNGTFVQLKAVTSWMKLAGLQGFQRIYEAQILGDYQSSHSLIAKVYYDFGPTAGQTTTITPNNTPPYQWRLQFKRQKCEAMKIELYDTQISPAEGMSLSALTLVVGIKYGANKMSSSRTFD